MDAPAQVEPVPAAGRREALLALVGGSRRDAAVGLRAEAYERLVRQCPGPHVLWWARRGGACVGVALVAASPGRVGMLFHSEGRLPGIDPWWLAPTIRGATGQALADGLSFVQALVPPRRTEELALLESAGLARLAELVYMRLDLTGDGQGPAGGPECNWRRYGQFGDAELAAVIQGTYEDSQDCPPLCGLRRLEDVIAGHMTCGLFSPESWWIAEVSSQPAGCALVNDSASDGDESELVYMGVLRPFRGQGLGTTMVRRAIGWARSAGRRALTVAVDGANRGAKRIYNAQGFRETMRRVAMFRPRPPDQAVAGTDVQGP